MYILAINTSHGICSVAISKDEVVIAQKDDQEPTRQAERLLPTINQLLEENNLSYQDIGAIAADIGPGSFTGIRIGLAAAHGIALAAKIPLIGVTGFEALISRAKENSTYENLMVVLDAKRGQVYVQYFEKEKTEEPLMINYEDIIPIAKKHHNFAIMGDGVHLVEPLLQSSAINYSIIEKLNLPDAGMVASVAYNKFRSGNFTANPAPLYIRPPDAKLPQK